MPTHSIPLLLVGVGPGPQFLDVEEQSHAISDLVDAHLLQYRLVHLQQILSIDVVLPEYLHVVSTVHTDQPVTHSVLVPVLC
jgi:hypothetical protein